MPTERLENFENVETLRAGEREISSRFPPRIRNHVARSRVVFDAQNLPLKAEDNVEVSHVHVMDIVSPSGVALAQEALCLGVVFPLSRLGPLGVTLHDSEVVGCELHRLAGTIAAEKAREVDLVGG